MVVDYIDKRFGSIAIKKGFITAEQLIEALTVQVREKVPARDSFRRGKL